MAIHARNTHDTIASPITPPGRGAVTVVRVSGPEVPRLAPLLCERGEEILRAPRVQVLTGVLDPLGTAQQAENNQGAHRLDHALVTFFPDSKSFTGEPTLEFGLHGSPYIVARFLEGLGNLGVRGAEPGEFSKRAFLNGKIDLTQAEAIADLISAETATQSRVAREQLEGKLSHCLSSVGEPLRNLLAEVEAYIDFPEEGIDDPVFEGWLARIEETSASLTQLVESYRVGRVLRDGALVCLAGIPNAGKSSLLNRLLGEERVIVSAEPGTTRDTVEERISLAGVLLRLCDTAGIELGIEAGVDEGALPPIGRVIGEVERQGIQRSWKSIRAADAVLFLYDPTAPLGLQEALYEKISREAARVVAVQAKCDLAPLEASSAGSISPVLALSARTGEGVAGLREHLAGLLTREGSQGEGVVVTTERHRALLDAARGGLVEAATAVRSREAPELLAFHIQRALAELTEIVGVTENEDILGRIFSKFCIGK